MDIEFIQEQLDNLATWGGAVGDIWDAIVDLFGTEEEPGAFANLSSVFEGADTGGETAPETDPVTDPEPGAGED